MNRVTRQRTKSGLARVMLAVMALVVGSGAFQPAVDDPAAGPERVKVENTKAATLKATGSIEIEWPGGKGREIPPGEEKLAFAEFNAFPATGKKAAHGEFTYRVLNADGTLHREIRAEVPQVFPEEFEPVVVTVDSTGGPKAWFVAEVVSDVRLCSGASCGSGDTGGGCGDDTTHDDDGCSGSGGTGGSSGPGDTGGGCGDDTTHDDDGCSGSGGTGGSSGPGDTGGGCGDDTTHDDDGCSGSGGTGGSSGPGDTGGGCGDDTTHDDGGCSGSGGTGGSSGPGDTGGGCGDDTTHDDGGCSGSGDTGGTHDDGGCSGSGGTGGSGGHISGKDSRVGQFVIVKVHDRATPGAAGDGAEGDGITWKWFAPTDDAFAAFIDAWDSEPRKGLCKKTIIGGNLVVHNPNE